MKYTYSVILIPHDEVGYIVYVPDLIGCISQSETPEKAPEEAKRIVAEWLKNNGKNPKEIPQPTELRVVKKELDEILAGKIFAPRGSEDTFVFSVEVETKSN